MTALFIATDDELLRNLALTVCQDMLGDLIECSATTTKFENIVICRENKICCEILLPLRNRHHGSFRQTELCAKGIVISINNCSALPPALNSGIHCTWELSCFARLASVQTDYPSESDDPQLIHAITRDLSERFSILRRALIHDAAENVVQALLNNISQGCSKYCTPEPAR